MPTPEEHLREEFGRLISGYVVQNSILKSENEALKRELAQLKEAKDGASQPSRLSE